MRKATTSKKRGEPKPDPYPLFVFICRSYLNIELERELRFHPVRKWRFDYASTEHKLAIEVEGGVWTKGRHTRPKGFLDDMEKYNNATALGWRVLRFVPDELAKPETLDLIKQTIRTTQQTNR
jgi:very-short-patch-repair endonuclease